MSMVDILACDYIVDGDGRATQQATRNEHHNTQSHYSTDSEKTIEL